MKILLVAPVHWHDQWIEQQREEQDRFGTLVTPFLIGQGQYFWWKALLRLGHDVQVERYSDPTPFSRNLNFSNRVADKLPFPGRRFREAISQKDRNYRNERILARVRSFRPDVVMVSGGTNLIKASTIQKIGRSFQSVVVHLNGTSPVVLAQPEEKEAAKFYDWIFTNDYYHSVQWKELGARNSRALPISACDPEYHRSIELDANEWHHYMSDVCFAGSLAPIKLYSERLHFLDNLSHLNLAIWSDDAQVLEDHPTLKKAYRGPAYGQEMLKGLSAAKLALNTHGCSMQRGGNLRTFEIPATRTLQLIDRYDRAWFTEQKEVVSFSTGLELRDRVTYYLQHEPERERIAQAGQERAYGEHTYDSRMSKLIELIKEGDEK